MQTHGLRILLVDNDINDRFLSRKDAVHFLQWIDQLEAKLRERDRVPSAALKARVQENLDKARAVYQEIAARGD